MVNIITITILASLLALPFIACGGGSSTSEETHWPNVITIGKDAEVTPILIQNEIEVGDNRISLGLLDKDNELILHGNVNLRLYRIDGETGILKTEIPAKYVGFNTNFVEERADATRVTHEGPEVGVYAAPVQFNEAGDWGIELTVKVNGKQYKNLRLRFNVLAKGNVPAIGDPARASQQFTLKDVQDPAQIDTSNPPHREMLNITVADALKTGKPIVLAFATPAFCTSRTCGPVMDKVMVPLEQKYGDQAIFIHIEPYDLNLARDSGQLVPVQAMLEWGLQDEPWIFLIDKKGLVAAKFLGIMGVDEVSQVLDQVLKY